MFGMGTGGSLRLLPPENLTRIIIAQMRRRVKHDFLAITVTTSNSETLLCYLFTGRIVRVFLTDAAAYEYGVSFARILLCTSFLFGVFYVMTNALQACGAAAESLIVNISRQGLIYIPAMFILAAYSMKQVLFGRSPQRMCCRCC